MLTIPVDVYVSGHRHGTLDVTLSDGDRPFAAAFDAALDAGYRGVEAIACDAHRITIRADHAPSEVSA